jgi:hypothetical protein
LKDYLNDICPENITSLEAIVTGKFDLNSLPVLTGKIERKNILNCITKLSEYFTLEPGDIILTGTPKGVQLENEILGEEVNYLKPGDNIELRIEGLGQQQNLILAS